MHTLEELQQRYAGFEGETSHTSKLLDDVITNVFKGEIAFVSSFGAESAVLLHLVAQIDRNLPIILVDTGKLFGETKRYRDQMINHLGLTDVRSPQPDADRLKDLDPQGILFAQDHDLCCQVRKVDVMQKAIEPFTAWISGRKRFQADSRADIGLIERNATHFKVNPLAFWTKDDLEAYFVAHDLPRHPLEEDGYLSIGCMTCTERVLDGMDARSGRWSGADKTECGIHMI